MRGQVRLEVLAAQLKFTILYSTEMHSRRSEHHKITKESKYEDKLRMSGELKEFESIDKLMEYLVLDNGLRSFKTVLEPLAGGTIDVNVYDYMEHLESDKEKYWRS